MLVASEAAPIAILAAVARGLHPCKPLAASDCKERARMIILPVTLTIAGAAALLNFWLALRVGRMRVAEKVSIGDGGNSRLTGRMRAHANYVEYTPFVLILLGLVELGSGTSPVLWAIGVLYILARIAHAFGMEAQKPGILRLGGIAVTMLTLIALAGWAIAIPYFGFQPTVTEIATVG
jgi:uncharacterized protein